MMVDRGISWRINAFFLIFLIILLPIDFSVEVNADVYGGGGQSTSTSISVYQTKGQDGFPKFRRRADMVSIIAQASFGGNNTIEPPNLEVFFGNLALGDFDECELVSQQKAQYKCSFTEQTGLGPVSSNTPVYTINLVNGTKLVKSVTATMTVDSKEPTINIFEPSSSRTSSQNVTVYYDVADYAYGTTPGVGLKRVQISQDDAVIFTYTSPVQDAATYDAAKIKTRLIGNLRANFSSGSATHNLCILAEDLFSFTSTKCTSVVVDKTAPEILADTFTVERVGADSIGYFTDAPVAVTVGITFRGEDLDTSTVRADLSEINHDPAYKSTEMDCTATPGEDYSQQCTVVVSARINSSRSYRFIFSAKDTLGNKADLTLTKSLMYDATGPVATGIEVPYFLQDSYVINSEKFTLAANLDEQGVGLNNSNVYADLSLLGLGSSVKASYCEPSWNCYWENLQIQSSRISTLPYVNVTITKDGKSTVVNTDARRASLKILKTSMDDLGNQPKKDVSFNVTVDVTPPTLVGSYYVRTISSSGDFENVTVVGDALEVKLNASDYLPVTMSVSADDFISNYNITQECTDLGTNVQSCYALIPAIENEGYYEGKLTITLTDGVGNMRSFDTTEIPVYEISNKTTTYWSSNVVECSPNPLDRQLTPKLSFNIYCQVDLSAASNVEIYKIDSGLCKSLEVTASSTSTTKNVTTLKTSSWIGLNSKSKSIIANLVTTTFTADFDTAEYQCPLYIRSIVDGTTVTRNSEQVNVSISLDLYNNPAGQISDSVLSQAKDVYNTYITGTGFEIISYLHSFFELSSKLCAVLGTLAKILTLLKQLKLTMAALTLSSKAAQEVGSGTPAAPGLIAAQTAISGGNKGTGIAFGSISTATKGSFEVLDKYCAFINCKLVWGSEAWQKWIKNLDKYVGLVTFNNYISKFGSKKSSSSTSLSSALGGSKTTGTTGKSSSGGSDSGSDYTGGDTGGGAIITTRQQYADLLNNNQVDTKNTVDNSRNLIGRATTPRTRQQIHDDATGKYYYYDLTENKFYDALTGGNVVTITGTQSSTASQFTPVSNTDTSSWKNEPPNRGFDTTQDFDTSGNRLYYDSSGNVVGRYNYGTQSYEKVSGTQPSSSGSPSGVSTTAFQTGNPKTTPSGYDSVTSYGGGEVYKWSDGTVIAIGKNGVQEQFQSEIDAKTWLGSPAATTTVVNSGNPNNNNNNNPDAVKYNTVTMPDGSTVQVKVDNGKNVNGGNIGSNGKSSNTVYNNPNVNSIMTTTDLGNGKLKGNFNNDVSTTDPVTGKTTSYTYDSKTKDYVVKDTKTHVSVNTVADAYVLTSSDSAKTISTWANGNSQDAIDLKNDMKPTTSSLTDSGYGYTTKVGTPDKDQNPTVDVYNDRGQLVKTITIDKTTGKSTSTDKLSFLSDSYLIDSIGGLNPKENWVLSLLTLCIPGMIYNLEKYRQIQCEYGNCLLTNSKSGIPTYICSENKAYSECRFFYGALFQFMPFASFISALQQALINILANPALLLDIVLDFACNSQLLFEYGSCGPAGTTAVCTTSTGGFALCMVYDTFTAVSEIWSDLQGYFSGNFFSFDFGPKSGSCKTFATNYEAAIKTTT